MGDTNIHVMNADGSEQVQLTEAAGREEDPVWSPDGTQIAYHDLDSPRSVTFMNADGSDPREVEVEVDGDIYSIGDWSSVN